MHSTLNSTYKYSKLLQPVVVVESTNSKVTALVAMAQRHTMVTLVTVELNLVEEVRAREPRKGTTTTQGEVVEAFRATAVATPTLVARKGLVAREANPFSKVRKTMLCALTPHYRPF